MECVVGITTDLEERETYWRNVAEVRDWEVVAGPFGAKMQAHEAAAQLAREHGLLFLLGERGVVVGRLLVERLEVNVARAPGGGLLLAHLALLLLLFEPLGLLLEGFLALGEVLGAAGD